VGTPCHGHNEVFLERAGSLEHGSASWARFARMAPTGYGTRDTPAGVPLEPWTALLLPGVSGAVVAEGSRARRSPTRRSVQDGENAAASRTELPVRCAAMAWLTVPAANRLWVPRISSMALARRVAVLAGQP
jgi:hypothetical protein